MLANVSRLLADTTIAGMKVRRDNVAAALDRNPILVTALNPIIGYEKAAAIAKRAYREGRPVFEIALEDSGLHAARLKKLLATASLTRRGLQGRSAVSTDTGAPTAGDGPGPCPTAASGRRRPSG